MKANKIEDLKQEYLSWINSVEIRKLAYVSARGYLKETQEKLRIAKSICNKTYMDWKRARLEAERTKRKWKTYPSHLRQWAKKNFGKVMENIERGFEE
jgi:hypothetical protein